VWPEIYPFIKERFISIIAYNSQSRSHLMAVPPTCIVPSASSSPHPIVLHISNDIRLNASDMHQTMKRRIGEDPLGRTVKRHPRALVEQGNQQKWWRGVADSLEGLNKLYHPSQEELDSDAVSPSDLLEQKLWEESAISALIEAGDSTAADQYILDSITAVNDPLVTVTSGPPSSSNPTAVSLFQQNGESPVFTLAIMYKRSYIAAEPQLALRKEEEEEEEEEGEHDSAFFFAIL